MLEDGPERGWQALDMGYSNKGGGKKGLTSRIIFREARVIGYLFRIPTATPVLRFPKPASYRS
jgi:hypothetical protein